MAGLDAKPIPASAHFRAVAYLRSRLFANSLRRKGGKGELIARLVVYPLFGAFALVPIVSAGFGAYAAVANDALPGLHLVFWGIFLLWQIVSINISPPSLSFDPESLIRFPLSFPRYLVIRIFLGLLAASTVVGCLSLLAAIIGIGISRPALVPIAITAALAFAVANILFTRMIFAWIDRWLSTRRAREVLTGLLFAIGITAQYLNVSYNGIGKHITPAQQAAKLAFAAHVFQSLQPIATWLPPGLAADTIVRYGQHQHAAPAFTILLTLLYAVVFLAIFAWRTHREFRGESLGDSVNSTTPAPRARTELSTAQSSWPSYGLPSSVAAILSKELLYVRRTTSQFYGLIAPVFMVLIFAGRLGSISRVGMAFPIGMAYSLLGLAAFPYNSLGLDQAGVQFYFLAPIRFRSIFLAKNLLLFAITVLQVAMVFGIVVYATRMPSWDITAITVLWVLFATLFNVAVGNIRSIVSPKKMDPGKLARKQASQLSALISIGVMLSTAALTGGVYLLGGYLARPWVPFPILLALAVAGLITYLRVLRHTDTLALTHRETLLEELGKPS